MIETHDTGKGSIIGNFESVATEKGLINKPLSRNVSIAEIEVVPDEEFENVKVEAYAETERTQ